MHSVPDPASFAAIPDVGLLLIHSGDVVEERDRHESESNYARFPRRVGSIRFP